MLSKASNGTKHSTDGRTTRCPSTFLGDRKVLLHKERAGFVPSLYVCIFLSPVSQLHYSEIETSLFHYLLLY